MFKTFLYGKYIQMKKHPLDVNSFNNRNEIKNESYIKCIPLFGLMFRNKSLITECLITISLSILYLYIEEVNTHIILIMNIL